MNREDKITLIAHELYRWHYYDSSFKDAKKKAEEIVEELEK